MSRLALAPVPSREMRGRSGFALVIVLGFIAMVSVLVIGVLVLSENETKTTQRNIKGLDAKVASDSVVQLVQAQIRDATLAGIDQSTKQGTYAWATQPGAVRVYNNTGALQNIYKLYSSDQMVTSSANFLVDGTDTPTDWAARKNEFVDLNEPVKRGTTLSPQWIYPIANPAAIGTVAGFDSTRTLSNSNWDDRLAMPVRWLYLDKNGRVLTSASAGDPVMRIAFWTDDESSKINLNTASASSSNSYADLPRADFLDERETIAFRQPSQGEYNRYPGHPATVNLKTVFTSAGISLQQLIEASPRYEWGGSLDATLKVNQTRKDIGEWASSGAQRIAKRDRLLTTPDEYLFSATTGGQRQSQLGLDAPTLDTLRFFVTTTSRSSDLNLFGRPRVTIWPISGINDANHRTPYDQLIAFCSTLGSDSTKKKEYFFQRSNPLSQTDDWSLYLRNEGIMEYLRSLTSTSVPGFGGNFLEKYDVDDGGVSGERDQILTEIFDYIRCVNLNETYRGQPSSFVSYTTKMDNPSGFGESPAIYDTYRGPGYVLPILIEKYGTRGAGRVPVISEVGLWMIQTQATVEIVNDPVTGKPTSEVTHKNPNPPQVQPALIFETFSPMQGFMPWAPYNFSIAVSQNTLRLVDTEGKYHSLLPGTLSSPNQQRNVFAGPTSTMGNGQATGGIDGFQWTMAAQWQKSSGGRASVDSNPLFTKRISAIPVVSGSVAAVPIAGARIGIASDENLIIQLRCDPTPAGLNKTTGIPFQKYEVKIPNMTLPVPDPVPWVPDPDGRSAFTELAQDGWYMRGTSPRFDIKDVVRGISLVDGDYRTIAYMDTVPAGAFASTAATLPDGFFDSSLLRVHGFRGGLNRAYYDTKNGKYVDVNYGSESPSAEYGSWAPKISPRITDLRANGWEGDFDNGLANLADGPMLNKSDEGANVKNSSAAQAPPYYDRPWFLGVGLFSPLKQMPSAVMFGSLPTGVKRTFKAYEGGDLSMGKPWRTLNFCPNPLAGTAHYGMRNPPDYLLLDLFTMPIVEPYAISEPFSTAGRLNMNYQIAPFAYISRKTSMHAALAAQKVIAIANTDARDYKSSTQGSSGAASRQIRYAVNADETLKQFDDRFAAGDIFRSASEICSIFLVPNAPGATANGMATWWNDYQLTGNNSRERPYATLYPLLTTKSNVFTTHLRAQAIKRLPDGRIDVQGEYRGSVTFERFLDPNAKIFTAGTVNPDDVSLEPYFRFRTLVAKQFDP